LRTAYLGTSDFAATVLRRLAASDHDVALVITPPDSRRGRGRKEAPPPVADAARELGLPVHQTETVNAPESVAALSEAGPEAVAICAIGQLIGDELLDAYTMLNVHPSLLPRWRGAAPIERAIMAGDERTGVSVMRPVAELDSGPVALAEEVQIRGAYFDELAGRLAELGGELLVRSLDALAAGSLEFAEQDEAGATYAEKIESSERRLDPSRDLVIDLSETLLVDHTVMEKLHELELEFEQRHRRLEIIGLDDHMSFSRHPHAARKRAIG